MKKGQLTPIYLIILVILIIAFFAVVNIGKVSLVKTHSANSADAGSIAAASIMATALNGIALTNDDLYKRFMEFHDIIDGGTRYSTYGSIIQEIPPALGQCACESAAASTKEFIGLVVSLYYTSLLYSNRQLKTVCLTAKTLQDSWMRAYNLALEMSIMNSGYFANVSPEERQNIINLFNYYHSYNQSTTSLPGSALSGIPSNALMDACNPLFERDWFAGGEDKKSSLQVQINVDKRKLAVLLSNLTYFNVYEQTFIDRLFEGARQQYLLAVKACVGCRILDCPATCSRPIAQASETINSTWFVPAMTTLHSLLDSKIAIVDRAKAAERNWCHVLSGRCTDLEVWAANRDPGSAVRESPYFLKAVTDRARLGMRPGFAPSIGDSYEAIHAYLVTATSAAGLYVQGGIVAPIPIVFYIQEDRGETGGFARQNNRSAIVKTYYNVAPATYTFWDATFPNITSYSETGFDYSGTFDNTARATLAPADKIGRRVKRDFIPGVILTDQLSIGNTEGNTTQP